MTGLGDCVYEMIDDHVIILILNHTFKSISIY